MQLPCCLPEDVSVEIRVRGRNTKSQNTLTIQTTRNTDNIMCCNSIVKSIDKSLINGFNTKIRKSKFAFDEKI